MERGTHITILELHALALISPRENLILNANKRKIECNKTVMLLCLCR